MRDYKDLFTRSGELAYSQKQIEKYIYNLKIFENWDENKRYLIRFEELLENPKTAIIKLAEFLKADPNRVQHLLENYETFKLNVFNSYCIHPGGTKRHIQQKKIRYMQVPKEKLLLLEEDIKSMSNDLFAKYLLPYSLTK